MHPALHIIFTDDRVSLETCLFNPSDRQADSSKRSFVFFLLEIPQRSEACLAFRLINSAFFSARAR